MTRSARTPVALAPCISRGGYPYPPRSKGRFRPGAAGAETRRARECDAGPAAWPLLAAGIITWIATAVPPAIAAGAPDREALGRTVKYRILVDKVMQPTKGWTTEEWMVEEAARCGFNVFCPRAGFDRLDEVRRVAGWCRERGLFFMPWMRGTLAAPKGKEADGRRYVWADGTEEPLWSPNADAFWDWTRRYVVAYGEIAKTNPHLVGVFLDYENYTPLRKPNCYELSYDDIILEKFAQARGIDLPALPLARRKAWLDEKGLHDAFEAFQVAHWRERCRDLRRDVDAHDPGFRFCVYPAPGTPFIVRAIYPEWATARAPLVLADAVTYGNRTGSLMLADALTANRERLLERRQVPQEAGIPFFYAGGIDPAVAGAEPEFSGKNADIIAQATDGYWVFYEGPEYAYEGPDPTRDHRAYFRWFARANRDIAAGAFNLWKEPRETPDPELQVVLDMTERLRQAGAAPLAASAPPEDAKAVLAVRGRHAFVLFAKEGEAVGGRLEVRRVGRYESDCAWILLGPDGARLANGRARLDEPAAVEHTAGREGLYVLVLDTGQNAARFRPRGRGACLLGPRVHLLGAQPRVYFLPMPGAKRLRLALETPSPGETARLVLRDPDGEEVAACDTVAKERALVTADVSGAAGGRPWSLDLGKAARGGCEDIEVEFLEGAVPLLAAHPSRLLRPERAFEPAAGPPDRPR
jgi:hypothetical protein